MVHKFDAIVLGAGGAGLWRCHSIYNCTDACPCEIQVTKAIG